MSDTPKTDELKSPLSDWRKLPEKSTLQLVDAEFAGRLERQNTKLLTAINEAIDNANGRESEWGERAEASFEILRSALYSK